jgi:RHS repeat-associated protein
VTPNHAVGSVLTHIDFNGRTNTFVYDSMNRLTQKTPDSGFNQSPITFTYYPTGVRSTMVDNVGTTVYNYDVRNRLLSKTTVAQASSLSLSYQYDFAGNLTRIQSGTSGGTDVTYEYDALNRLSTVIDAHRGTLVTTNSYDAVGNLAGYHYPNGVDTVYRYNTLNRLTNMTVSAGGQLAKYDYTLGVANSQCGCSAGSQITAVSEVIGSRMRNVAYGYDATYRLTNEMISVDSVGPTGNIGYSYDDVGNRLTRTSNGAVASQVPSASYGYDANDRLNTDSYDANGNTTNSASNVDRYDFENRLTNRNDNVFFRYDGDGNRVGKVAGGTNTIFLVDDNNPTGYSQVLEEFTSVSSGATNLTRVYTYGSGLISQDWYSDSSWSLSYYGYDGHGNVRLLTVSGGAITDTYTYDAFGNLIHSTATTPNDNLYNGEKYDKDLGLYDQRARLLNPITGRFWTQDRYEGNQSDPISLHRYLYAADDPVNKIDPSGNEGIEAMLAALAIDASLNAIQFAPVSAKQVVPSCGPEVYKQVRRTLWRMEAGFRPLDISQKKKGCSALWRSSTAEAAWDITELAWLGSLEQGGEGPNIHFGDRFFSPARQGNVGRCAYTVAYQGRCYKANAVNYAALGRAWQLCNEFVDPKVYNAGSLMLAVAFQKAGYWMADFGEANRFALSAYSENPISNSRLTCSECRVDGGNYSGKWKFGWHWTDIGFELP